MTFVPMLLTSFESMYSPGPKKVHLRSEYAWASRRAGISNGRKLRGLSRFPWFLDGFDRAGACYIFQKFRAVEKIFARAKTSNTRASGRENSNESVDGISHKEQKWCIIVESETYSQRSARAEARARMATKRR